MRARNGIRQARKGIKADKEWHKSRQIKERYKGGRKNTKAGQKRYNKTSRQGKPIFKIKIINPIHLYRRG